MSYRHNFLVLFRNNPKFSDLSSHMDLDFMIGWIGKSPVFEWNRYYYSFRGAAELG